MTRTRKMMRRTMTTAMTEVMETGSGEDEVRWGRSAGEVTDKSEQCTTVVWAGILWSALCEVRGTGLQESQGYHIHIPLTHYLPGLLKQ